MADEASVLAKSLAAHGVKATLRHTYRGPSITLYAYQLAPGQNVRAVNAIATDLAVAVGQEAVRILTPIPDTSLIGIEVPNDVRCTVDYEPETSGWKGPSLSIPIGVDVKNHVIEADLTTLPHLLIAGSTGSGKSVALSTIITALIDRNSPAELRLHLIDPKRVELTQFADAPQVENLVTDLDYIEALLDDIVDLMDYRYELFEDCGVRNIAEYNQTAPEGDPIPFHVVVIDEMADLMMQRKKTIEPLIVRIAQLARAAGIHLILATQRPTVDVITGLIKANVPSRLAFTVASVKDSMVILDQTGANALAGKGDALFLPIGQNRPVRVQGLWTSDDRIQVVVDKARANFERPTQATSGMRADDGLSDLPDLPFSAHLITDDQIEHGELSAAATDVVEDATIMTESGAAGNKGYDELMASAIRDAVDHEIERRVSPPVPTVSEKDEVDRRGVGIACLALGLGIGAGFELMSALVRAIF